MKRKQPLAFIIITIAACLMLIIPFAVSAQDDFSNNNVQQYYTSIKIQSGETLWSIAKDYCHELNMSEKEYIKSIKSMNQLTTDQIHSGQNLMIVYAVKE